MYFVVIGRDGTDEGALARRMSARDAHVADMKAGIASGRNIMAAALLNDAGEMNTSVLTMQFDDRAALDAWLAAEPYVTGNVWEDITVTQCKVPPLFLAE